MLAQHAHIIGIHIVKNPGCNKTVEITVFGLNNIITNYKNQSKLCFSMTNEIKTVGFIGVGTMGRGMVQNLAKKGFFVLAYNRTKSKIEDLTSDKIKIVDTVKEVCGADLVITCLPNDKSLEDVFFGGIETFIEKDAIYSDCGTTSVDFTEKISKICMEKDIAFLDAPLTGSKLKAASGALTIMVGGNKEALKVCMPVFKSMGTTIVHCGANTYGQRAKIALNMAQALILESYLESIILGVKNGVPLKAMEEILENSAAKNGAGSFKLPYIKKRDFEQHFMLKLMHKDLMFADHERKRLGLNLPLAEKISGIFGQALDRGDEDIITIVKTLEKDANIELKE